MSKSGSSLRWQVQDCGQHSGHPSPASGEDPDRQALSRLVSLPGGQLGRSSLIRIRSKVVKTPPKAYEFSRMFRGNKGMLSVGWISQLLLTPCLHSLWTSGDVTSYRVPSAHTYYVEDMWCAHGTGKEMTYGLCSHPQPW